MDRMGLFGCALVWFASSALGAASPYRGVVTFAGLPLPGATITATQTAKRLTAVTNQAGAFEFDDLTDGEWTIEIGMQCFETIRARVTIVHDKLSAHWDLRLLPLDQLNARAHAMSSVTDVPLALVAAREKEPPGDDATQDRGRGYAQSPGPEMPKAPQAENEQSADGLLVQGSVNNAATSMYAISPAFGNTRPGSKALYTGGFATFAENSALNARPYSLSGIEAAKPVFSDFTGVVTLQGPIRIPNLLPRGPDFSALYQWMRSSNPAMNTGLVPTQAERNGNLSVLTDALGQPVMIHDLASDTPYPNNQVPVSLQAAALLKFYPLPNIADLSNYNYQAPVLNESHENSIQTRLDKIVGRKGLLYGRFAVQSTSANSVNLFGFDDQTGTLGINSDIHWTFRIKPRVLLFTGYSFSRLRTNVTPNFENRINVSGVAGIGGNDQSPAEWGPPALNFSRGIAPLSDAQSAFNRNRTDGFSGSIGIYQGHHNITIGADARTQQYNDLFQQDPRGTFTFTGEATGSDLADFLIGIPDASSIAFGNADKYFRQHVYDTYASDDWRVLPNFTVNAGVRWEYGAPMTELHARLVNLDVAPGFTKIAPVLGRDPAGTITGRRYSNSLVQPDRSGVEPRIGISWRPIPASTIVIRAGYGIYHDTSVYLTPILQLAQQAPLSKSVKVQNSLACPLTLAAGFIPCVSTAAQTFGLDPNFRVGYAQNWNLALQRDLPGSLQLTATYLGVKGTHGVQQFLPNSYPLGGVNPCPECPSGFVYETSGGNSTRQSGQLQLRRRLRSGLTALLLYTYSKSIDDVALLGGQGQATSEPQGNQSSSQVLTMSTGPAQTAAIAQDWRDLRAERSLSSFNQRHFLNLQAQYTTGQGPEGATLMRGWPGRLLKEWTLLTRINVGSGFPETPVFPASVPGTGLIGTLRPSLTGAPIYTSQGHTHLNGAAYAAPAAGSWGTAARNSIRGPNRFSLDGALQRTFRPTSRFYLDARIDANNLLNHVVFNNWVTTIGNTQFGQPVDPSQMRSLQTTLRLRF